MVETSLTVLIIVEGQKPASVELKRVDRNLTVRCNCSSEDKICNHIISTLFGEEARIVGCDGTLTKTIADTPFPNQTNDKRQLCAQFLAI